MTSPFRHIPDPENPGWLTWDLTQEGRFDLGDYIVEVVPGLSGVSIRVFDVLSGDESVITIPSY